MKKAFYYIKEVIGWVVFLAVLVVFITTMYSFITNENKDEGVYALGYRPELVLTGSMEPYMMQYSITFVKQVNDLDELAVGDVISFHTRNFEDRLIRITHRIVDIKDGYIYTKGDNNAQEDGIPLSMEDVESKVLFVFNGTAWVADKWQESTAGKVMIVSLAIGFVFFCFLIRGVWQDISGKWKLDGEDVKKDVIESAVSEPKSMVSENDDQTSRIITE